jgi:hypothetical protein
VKDMCFGYGVWAGLRWICMFCQDLDLGLDSVSEECFILLGFRSFPIFLSLLSTGYLGLGGFQGLRLFSLLFRPF